MKAIFISKNYATYSGIGIYKSETSADCRAMLAKFQSGYNLEEKIDLLRKAGMVRRVVADKEEVEMQTAVDATLVKFVEQPAADERPSMPTTTATSPVQEIRRTTATSPLQGAACSSAGSVLRVEDCEEALALRAKEQTDNKQVLHDR